MLDHIGDRLREGRNGGDTVGNGLQSVKAQDFNAFEGIQ